MSLSSSLGLHPPLHLPCMLYQYIYHFQVKDQIGCFVYFPALGMHRAAGGSGGLRVNSSFLIPVPFADPADDYTVLVGD
ncbi:hypothetical protein BHM03_00011449 [Ensete ventricosum]|nr:hypothetical protein BHM03_00011449 [Ensete ventricosum]